MRDGEGLPEGWAQAKVGDLANAVEPGFPHGGYNLDGIGVPHLRPMNIDAWGRLCLDEIKYVDVPHPPMLRAGDVLFNNTNSPVWVGKTTYIPEDDAFTFSNHMTRVRFNERAGDPRFYALQLHHLQQTGYFEARCNHHVNQASIASSYLSATVDLAVAPAAEQRRIVEAIEQQFTRLEAGVAALKRARAALKRYRAAVLKAAVEGRLTATWRAEHPNVEPASDLLQRILAKRRAKWEADMRAKGKDPVKTRYVAPEAPDAANLTVLPEGWCWATVEQVSHSVRYGSSAKTSEDSSGIPVLRMGNIKDGNLDFTNLKYLPVNHAEFPGLLLEPGDVLFNRTNSAELVGKAAVYHGMPQPCSYASYLITARTSEECMPDYLCYYINSPYGRRWVASVVSQQVGQANVNGSKLQTMTFPLPPLAEQEQIVADVEQRLSIVSELEATMEANLKRADRLRQSILERAFAGKLVPQDPNDEPASVLLERIREQREGPKSNGRIGNGRTAHQEMSVTTQETLWGKE